MPIPAPIPYPEGAVIPTLMFQYHFLDINWESQGEDMTASYPQDDQGKLESPQPPVLGTHLPPAIPTVEAVFKNPALRVSRLSMR